MAPDWTLAQPVPPLVTARIPERVRVPEEVMGPPVKVRPVEPPEALTEETVPPAIQFPDMAKQPAVRLMPLAKVEEALVPFTLMGPVMSNPAPKVEVAEPKMVVVEVSPT